MSKKLAIKGHATRCKEVIELLEMLGAQNPNTINGCCTYLAYYIEDGSIEALSSYNDNDFIVFTLEEFLEKYPYKVGDKVNSPCKGCIKTITSMKWDEYLNTVLYKLDDKIYTSIEELKVINDLPYKEEVNMEDKKLFGTVSNPVETKSYTVSLKDDKVIDNSIDASQFMQIGKILAVCFNPENYENEVELQLGNYEIEVRDGKTYAVFKKPKYPKTYAECCEVLVGRKPKPHEISFDRMELCLVDSDYTQNIDFQAPYLFQLNCLFRVLMCCKAYCKIAGEEMGLDKPWEPDLENEELYCIQNYHKQIVIGRTNTAFNKILIFPSEEMCNTFYENFKDLIEGCKELL